MTYRRPTYEELEIAALQEALRRYGERWRMGTVEPSSVQQAIDRALEGEDGPPPTYQDRVAAWLLDCFGPKIAAEHPHAHAGRNRSKVAEVNTYVFPQPKGLNHA